MRQFRAMFNYETPENKCIWVIVFKRVFLDAYPQFWRIMTISSFSVRLERRRAVNAIGSEPSVGFLHEFTGSQTEAKRQFFELLKDGFNSGVKRRGKMWKWNTVILNKATKLTRFLQGKSNTIDSVEPTPRLERSDGKELRKRILSLTLQEARRLGINKSTLHTIREHAPNEKPFKVYLKVASRLR